MATRKDLEHVNAAWLILPVSNFVAALVGPGLDQAYVPAMQLWFAFALMLWVLLFAITFAKAIIVTDNGGCCATLCWLSVACHACSVDVRGCCSADVFMQARGDTVFIIPVMPHTTPPAAFTQCVNGTPSSR